MRLTTKGRYAVTAMLDLALHYEQGPISLADISRRQGISLSYLEQLFARLRKKGLVGSVRGPGGGYRLSREAGKISIIDVITAVDENMDATRCGGLKNCQENQRCLTHDLWEDLSRQIYEFLARITLGELVQRDDIKKVAMRLEDAVSVNSVDRAVPVVIIGTNRIS
ncbi:Fe-S cluster assembly transcriptional regulator IscR [Nitrosococcus oceani]|uniref:Transcriptional regulator, BadM/Rrf2 family n=2 Tax=Nitrosococcus oceani TaxID=1229 RepID=Q3JAM6_NITOC|nr:Fe-S cluster assembly transcriptional regulator IscR [Nitrosococcus oceani]KFI19451.1 transcriptional regulator [Nitrosococcus oceani C-27]ABA58120.1 transcriptional regulator, BadM/Rrf2 family [Nitrosococcus oceani ATCC 19707]EDZ68436.1 iron-sulfur cluster assembly transcription factor IscR [Nitrosococcus oceani AFC27]KFI22696.1 transcriptional regulator [Nitrosococcus oceani]GEM21293.1 Fe-S cluster assembly transcriptional regulator IscR [Nitrosococcus oceani]